MAVVYDVSYLEREIDTKGPMLLEEIERANRLARSSLRRKSVEEDEVLRSEHAALPKDQKTKGFENAKGIKKEKVIHVKEEPEEADFPGEEPSSITRYHSEDEYSYRDEPRITKGHHTSKDSTHDERKYRSRYQEESVDTEYEEKTYYAKYCRDQNVNPTLIQAATPIVHIPKSRNEERFPYDEEIKAEPHSPPLPQKRRRRSHDDEDVYSGGEFLEVERADQIQYPIEDKKMDGIYEGDLADGAGEELVLVEESKPDIAGTLDSVSLKYTTNGDKCTLGEVAERVMEINVDDPYDLCSLLATEKQESADDCASGRGGSRRKLYQGSGMMEPISRRSKSFVSTMLPKGKDGRTRMNLCRYPYKCSRCDSWFEDDVELKVHMSTHKKKSFKSVKDFIHEKIFRKPEESKTNTPLYVEPPKEVLVRVEPPNHHSPREIIVPYFPPHHIIPAHGVPMETIYYPHPPTTRCDLCNLHFRSHNDLLVHLQQEHKMPPVANGNGESATKAKNNNQSVSNPYKCSQCPASFGTSFNLKRHQRIHTGTRPYKCGQCQAAFITKAQLTTHQRTHTGEKPYKCHICGGRFIQQNNLKRHVMTHTGQKPFKCDRCPAAFISSSDLKRHIRVHTGEKPYKCVHCNKGFTTSGNLSSHYKMHTGEKPYKCNLCNASFSHQSNLKTHVKRHVLPFKCGCGEGWATQSELFKHMETCKVAKEYHPPVSVLPLTHPVLVKAE